MPKQMDNRFEDNFKKVEKLLGAMEKEMARAYKDALIEVDAKLTKLYRKYSQSGSLTFNEMSKYDRLKNMLKDINGAYNKATNQSRDITIKTMTGITKDGYYKSGWIFETESGMSLNFRLLPKKAIEEIVLNPQSGLDVIKTFSKNKIGGIFKIRQAITQGLIQGESVRKMADRIKDQFEKGYSDAERVIRTEGLRVYETAKLKAFDKAEAGGLKLKRRWIAGIDDRTRSAHISMNGTFADKNNKFVLVAGIGAGQKVDGPHLTGIASQDINCRCTTVAEPDNEEAFDDKKRNEDYLEWLKINNIKGVKNV